MSVEPQFVSCLEDDGLFNMSNKIAFFRIWTSPPVNLSVEKMLVRSFPESSLETYNLADLIRQKKEVLLQNSLRVMQHYGPQILMGKRSFKVCFWRTPYIFQVVKSLAAEILSRGQHHFSFQLHSLYDASYPGVPHFVYTDHTHLENLNYPGFGTQDLFHPSWIRLERSIYHNATLVFTRSSNIRRSVIDHYAVQPERVVCVFGGSNVSVPKEGMLKRSYDQETILFVGSDWGRKGGPDLIQAFELLLKTNPSAKLVIVGASPDISLPNCTVVGRVPLEKMPAYYQQASIFCLPTRLEPFGMVFVEAMSYKLPIVATHIGAIPDMVVNGANGYLVTPGDIQELAKRLCLLLDDPERCRQFGAVGYRLVQSRYNWDAVGDKIRENILAVMG